MSIVTRPIPNQPLFVWPIHQTAISFRGHVQSKQGHHLSVYAKVIAGTQVGTTIPVARLASFRSGTARLYGYFLPTHWLLGATRYRFRLIVHIWNLMVGGIQLIVRVGAGPLQKLAVTADGTLETESIHATHMTVSSTPEHEVRLWFNVANIARSLFVMANSGAVYVYKLVVGFRGVPAPVLYALKLSAHVGSMMVQPIKILARAAVPIVDKTIKILANIPADIMERVSRLSANPSGGELERLHKMAIELSGLKLEKLAKLSVAIKACDMEELAKLSVAIQSNNIEAVSKLLVAIPIPEIERLLKMSARLTPEEIIHVLSDLKADVEGQWLEQDVAVKTDAVASTLTKPVVVKSDVKNIITPFSVKAYLEEHVSAAKGLIVHMEDHISTVKDLIVSTIQFVNKQLMKVFTPPSEVTQVIYCPFLPQNVERELDVSFHADNIERDINMRILPTLTHEEAHYIEAQVLTLAGHKNLMFRPAPLPPVHRAQCLVSVCNTAVQSYINMYLEEYKQQTGQVRVSMCQGFVRRLIQWYLMGGRVSNEGWGNEVIFDLGEINPVGPIPPAPSLSWGGGYVEDPFIGAGYIPAEEGTGYESPEVTKWVENVRMYWNGATEPFEGK